jgi:hypothetical protein
VAASTGNVKICTAFTVRKHQWERPPEIQDVDRKITLKLCTGIGHDVSGSEYDPVRHFFKKF